MKTKKSFARSFTFIVSLLIMIGCGHQNQFGKKVSEEGAITVDELVNRLVGEKEFGAKVKGKISDACKEEGCWFEFKASDGSSVMVTYKDKAFNLPVGIEGKEVIIDGRAFIDSTGVSDLKTQAKEEGKSTEEIDRITEPEYFLAFEAEGVLIKE